jgi:predicted PurR-regulated permease PerM
MLEKSKDLESQAENKHMIGYNFFNITKKLLLAIIPFAFVLVILSFTTSMIPFLGALSILIASLGLSLIAGNYELEFRDADKV